MSRNQIHSSRAFRVGVAAVSLAAALVTASCSGTSAAPEDGKKSLVLGFPGGIGTTDVPAILALEALADDEWETKYIEFDSPDVQTQALLRGDIDVASMGPATVMAANLAGADMRIVANNNKNDLQIVAAADIKECADLDGKPVAYHSEGSTSTAHLRRWLSDTCPDAKPEFLVISGSGNRAAALIEGQIAGTVVRLEDWVPAITGNESKAQILASLSKDQSDLLTQTIVVNGKAIEGDRGLVEAFTKALETQLDLVNDDPIAFAAKAAKVLKNDDVAALEAIYKMLSEQGVFPDSSDLSKDDVATTISFYQENGTIPEGELKADDVADFSF